MGNKAKNLVQQIAILQKRGMVISDIEKAKEVLLDVGYYRLGFYWFPFEQSYPSKQNRTHELISGTNFDDAVQLYYFDYNLRSILSYYIQRIEINFRNYVTYTLSNRYDDNPLWFVDHNCVEESFISEFDTSVYNSGFKLNTAIKYHHRNHPEDKYAPAWKTCEYMTFGSVLNLYKALKDSRIKIDIANHYGIRYTEVLENYLEIVRELRNYCAHGNVLYDFVPFKYIRRGPANVRGAVNFRNLYGSILVVMYLLKQVSENRYKDMRGEVDALIVRYSANPKVLEILSKISGLTPGSICSPHSKTKCENSVEKDLRQSSVLR